jgi:hypothetical protein
MKEALKTVHANTKQQYSMVAGEESILDTAAMGQIVAHIQQTDAARSTYGETWNELHQYFTKPEAGMAIDHIERELARIEVRELENHVVPRQHARIASLRGELDDLQQRQKEAQAAFEEVQEHNKTEMERMDQAMAIIAERTGGAEERAQAIAALTTAAAVVQTNSDQARLAMKEAADAVADHQNRINLGVTATEQLGSRIIELRQLAARDLAAEKTAMETVYPITQHPLMDLTMSRLGRVAAGVQMQDFAQYHMGVGDIQPLLEQASRINVDVGHVIRAQRALIDRAKISLARDDEELLVRGTVLSAEATTLGGAMASVQTGCLTTGKRYREVAQEIGRLAGTVVRSKRFAQNLESFVDFSDTIVTDAEAFAAHQMAMSFKSAEMLEAATQLNKLDELVSRNALLVAVYDKYGTIDVQNALQSVTAEEREEFIRVYGARKFEPTDVHGGQAAQRSTTLLKLWQQNIGLLRKVTSGRVAYGAFNILFDSPLPAPGVTGAISETTSIFAKELQSSYNEALQVQQDAARSMVAMDREQMMNRVQLQMRINQLKARVDSLKGTQTPGVANELTGVDEELRQLKEYTVSKPEEDFVGPFSRCT